MKKSIFAALGIAIVGLSGTALSEQTAKNVFTRDGLTVKFDASAPLNIDGKIYGEDIVEVTLKITDANSGEPVSGLYPAAWIDPLLQGAQITEESCRQKAGTYLSGYIGIRPMIDLNSYYLVVLNEDPTIAIIDPIIGVKGITKLLTQVILPAPGSDWARALDEKTVYVAIPSMGLLSVVDLENFRLQTSVSVGDRPSRVMMQPDGQAIWVATVGNQPGVSIVDPETLKSVAHIETGRGHHELAFSGDSSRAFVTNRDVNTVSVIDTATRNIIQTLDIPATPIDVAYSEIADAIYVVAAGSGDIHVIDPERLDIREKILLKKGLGPLRFTPDGRYGFVANPGENSVTVIDTASNGIAHEIEIPDKPFQVVFSRNFAFIRALESNRVSMVNLNSLKSSAPPPVLGFNAGERAPNTAPKLLAADLFAPAVTEAAMLAVSPGDATVYYYMEGMNAPMGNFRNYGHRPLSAMVADRTIKEQEPGVYKSRLKLPSAGDFQVIMTLDAPQLIECFKFSAEQNPQIVEDQGPARIAYQTRSGAIAATGERFSVGFNLTDPAADGAPITGKQVKALVYRAPGQDRREVIATETKSGHYEVSFEPKEAGVYYVYPAVDELGLTYAKLPFITIVSRAAEG